MKTIVTTILTLAAITLLSHSSFAQEACETGTCNLPPQAIGAGGLTCEKAAAAFQTGKGIKDTLNYDARNIAAYALSSEVYCYPHFGMIRAGNFTPTLEFNISNQIDPLTGDYVDVAYATLKNILGLAELSSDNNAVVFNEHGDSCFSRYQLVQHPWSGWTLPMEGRMHYFSYQCRSPEKNEDALICKISYDGRLDVGYQVYSPGYFSRNLPEGIME